VFSEGKGGQSVVSSPVVGPLNFPSLFSLRLVLRILCILILIHSNSLTYSTYLSVPSSSLRIYRIPYQQHIGYSLQPGYQPCSVFQIVMPELQKVEGRLYVGGRDETYMHIIESFVDIIQFLVVGDELVYP
jgi:hypothetical protein